MPRSTRGQPARQRRHHVGQVLDRRDQHQHRGDEGDEAADRGAAARCSATAPATITADSAHRGQHLRHRRHRRRRRPPTSASAGARGRLLAMKRVACWRRRAVQPHDAPGQHVLLDHVGQLVGGLSGPSTVSRCRRRPMMRITSATAGNSSADEQRQLPVQPQQVAEQRDQRQRVADQRQQRADEQRARRSAPRRPACWSGRWRVWLREQRRRRRRAGASNIAVAQRQHAAVGGPGQRRTARRSRPALRIANSPMIATGTIHSGESAAGRNPCRAAASAAPASSARWPR